MGEVKNAEVEDKYKGFTAGEAHDMSMGSSMRAEQQPETPATQQQEKQGGFRGFVRKFFGRGNSEPKV